MKILASQYLKDLIYFDLEINNGDIWNINKTNKKSYCGSVKLMRTKFIEGLKNDGITIDECKNNYILDDGTYFEDCEMNAYMKLSDGIINFFEKNNDKEICFVTDLTAYIQYRKIC